MVFLGAVARVLAVVEFGAVAEPLAIGGGQWLPDPTTQPTTPRMMTTALMATIRNLFMVLPSPTLERIRRENLQRIYLQQNWSDESQSLMVLDTGLETAVPVSADW